MQTSVEERLGRLERSNRLHRLAVVSIACAVTFVLAVGQAAPNKDPLVATGIVIKDTSGKTRVIAGETSPGTWGIAIVDTRGKTRLSLVNDTRADSAGLRAYDKGGARVAEAGGFGPTGRITLRSGESRADFYCSESGAAVQIVDVGHAFFLGTMPQKNARAPFAGLQIADKSSIRLISLGFGELAELSMADRKDKKVWRYPPR